MGQDGSTFHRLKLITAATSSAVVVVVVVAAALPQPQAREGSTGTRQAPRRDGRLPDPVQPAFTVVDPPPLRPDRWDSVWAQVARPADLHARPSRSSPAVARVSPVTPEGTDNIVLTSGRATDGAGRLWVRVRASALPTNIDGWVTRDALGGYGVVHTRLVIDLGDMRAVLYRRGREIFAASVGVGRAGWPTPTGTFYIRSRLQGFDDPFYGPVAFGTSARSAGATDWPAGGFVGIHGTNLPELIPGRVSHGCVRMRNPDIVELSRLMPVGTPLEIRP